MMLAILLILASGSSTQVAISDSDFVSLFNGKTLSGWKLVGQKGAGYYVQDGDIVCPEGGGGNLFSEKQYEDFILRFEFKLEHGSNNGLAIRSPLKAGTDIAYDGMELQIIDNSAERYQNILPWQKHGSLYHVFPAKTGFLLPVGKWNYQEVTVSGRNVRVILNSHMILDIDLDSIKDPNTLRQHPGLKRTTGHIGFLGHNEPIRFRNVKIKVLQN